MLSLRNIHDLGQRSQRQRRTCQEVAAEAQETSTEMSAAAPQVITDGIKDVKL